MSPPCVRPLAPLSLLFAWGCAAAAHPETLPAPPDATSPTARPAVQMDASTAAAPLPAPSPPASQPDAGRAPSTSATTWPNETSSANSDPWLVANHDRLTLLRPRVLVINFDNGTSEATARMLAERAMAGIAEGSRYHGYFDAAAPAFVQIELAKLANLTDAVRPPDWTYSGSTHLPRKPDGKLDYKALLGEPMAAKLGLFHPSAPGRALTLCEAFEKGVVNEVWVIVAYGDPGTALEMVERKQVYDLANTPILGRFENCAGNGCVPDNAAAGCKVSVRIGDLNPGRGPGCALHAFGHAMEGVRRALPYLARESERFFNFGLKRRRGTLFDSFYSCPSSGPCISYPTPDRAVSVPESKLQFDLANWGDGCGNVHYPSNATYNYDYKSKVPVLGTCESYGLGDGPGGADLKKPYTSDQVAAYERRFGDCGGGWQVYLRQSFPGLGNQAKATDGTRMRNWWPFLYY